MKDQNFVSRAGQKLAFALEEFGVDVKDKVCIDLGCSTGGFTDALLQAGAKKIYAVDTGYGVLDWKLRQDPQVEVHERQNALHFEPPEKADLVTVDASWTKQEKILPVARGMLKEGGQIITLIKPHYELGRGSVSDEEAEAVVEEMKSKIEELGLRIEGLCQSPILGKSGGNPEWLCLLELA